MLSTTLPRAVRSRDLQPDIYNSKTVAMRYRGGVELSSRRYVHGAIGATNECHGHAQQTAADPAPTEPLLSLERLLIDHVVAMMYSLGMEACISAAPVPRGWLWISCPVIVKSTLSDSRSPTSVHGLCTALQRDRRRDKIPEPPRLDLTDVLHLSANVTERLLCSSADPTHCLPSVCES